MKTKFTITKHLSNVLGSAANHKLVMFDYKMIIIVRKYESSNKGSLGIIHSECFPKTKFGSTFKHFVPSYSGLQLLSLSTMFGMQ